MIIKVKPRYRVCHSYYILSITPVPFFFAFSSQLSSLHVVFLLYKDSSHDTAPFAVFLALTWFMRVTFLGRTSVMYKQRNVNLTSSTSRPCADLSLEQFSLECRELVNCISALRVWLKKQLHCFISSEVKPKPIVSRSHPFLRVLRLLRAFALSLHWLTGLSVS